MTDEKIYYVYVDYTVEEIPRPFYVGKGDKNRVYRKYRNKTHTGISNKYGCKREVVLETKIEKEAHHKEIELIALYKTNITKGCGFWGANFTDGGDGTSGSKLSEEHKQKISDKLKGIIRSKEYKNKMSEATKGKIVSEETRRKLSEINKSRKRVHHTEETKRKISNSQKGEKNHMFGKVAHNFGKKHTEESKRKISETAKNRKLRNKNESLAPK